MPEFQSISQIQNYYEQKEKSAILAKKNYYVWSTKRVLGSSGILKKYEKKLDTYEKTIHIKMQKAMEKAVKNLGNGKNISEKKKEKSITKEMAKKEIQLYARISRADPKTGLVKEITTGELMPRYETQGGHYFSAQRNSTCFSLGNIRPQLPISNYLMSQGGKKAEEEKEKYKKNLIKEILSNYFEFLENKIKREKINPREYKLTRRDVVEYYKKYKHLNDELLKKNGRSRKKPYVL